MTGQRESSDAPESRRPHADRDIDYMLAGISPRRRAFNDVLMRLGDGTSEWLRRHWLGVVNGTLATFIGVAVATPLAYAAGLTGPASAVFHAYRFACDELPSHSFFVGGYQMCLCSRCLAIYTSLLLFGLGLTVARKYRVIHSMSWWMWLLAMLPMALDGGTQFFGLRESTVWLRLLTGAIFGIGTGWFMLGHIEAAAEDDGAAVARVRARAQ
jgi:uncharacterized membrane protein